MKKNMLSKTLILGIVVLFIGAIILPSVLGRNECLIAYNKQNISFVDPPDEEWNKTFGGVSSESGRDIKQTSDGGYIIAGYTYSYGAGDADAWLLKLDASGNYEWDSTFGGPEEDSAWSVALTPEGGYILTGRTQSYGAGNRDLWLIKADGNGNHLWNKTFGSTGDDMGFSVGVTNDGNYIVTGQRVSFASGTDDDAWLIKTDIRGDEIWNRTYGADGYERGYSVVQTIDGGYIIAGFTTSYSDGWMDFWLIKTDSMGILQWDKTYDAPSHDAARSVVQTQPDTGYIMTGYRYSSDTSSYDLWFVKTDPNGNHIWNKTYGSLNDDGGWSVFQASDGGYAATGYSELPGGNGFALWILKIFDSGNLAWDIVYDGLNDESGQSIIQATDGGYVITGYTSSFGNGANDAWVIKLKIENPPPNPPTIDGPTSGDVGTEYTYTIITNEPDGDDVYYYVDWGDGEFEDWFGPFASGTLQTISHTWTTEGTYEIKGKAKDTFDAESDWTILTVTIPRNKAINRPILNWLQSHPSLFPLL